MGIEHLIACLAGVSAGFIAGLLPGIGVSVFMILAFTFLMKLPLVLILIFYCSMVSACQFGGSITALAVGLPGETNSIPLLRIRDDIIREDNQLEALFLCAFGHFVGAISTFVLSYLIIDFIATNTDYLRVYVMIGFSAIGLIMCSVFSDNRWWMTLLMIPAGWTLSKIGIDPYSKEHFLTFGNMWLSGGLPVISVLLGMYAIPNIVKSIDSLDGAASAAIDFNRKLVNKLKLIKDNVFSMIRGSWIGFFAGLIPYVGIDVSAYIAFYVERWLKNSSLRQATAAETATNAAGISVLLPVLIYGIAIQPSENLLLEITNTSAHVLNWITVKPIFETVAAWLIIANIISFFLSWNLAGAVIKNLYKLGRYTPWILTAICTYTVFKIGYSYGQGLYYIIVLAVFSTIGLLLRNQDKMPFIFVFLLQDRLEPAIVRMLTLYF